MICATIPPLRDICATSIVYRMWTYQNVYKNWNAENHWRLLEEKIIADVKELPLPELMKSLVLSFVKPAGRHFFGLLYIWFKKLMTSERWLTDGMLTDCLTLYPVGIINQRRTAEKLLRSKMLHNIIAFRLACINFLEVEVLRLWPRVLRYFLNKIVLDPKMMMIASYLIDAHYSVQEPTEVLFWISYCLAKELGTDLKAIPHYQGSYVHWIGSAAYYAKVSGDIAIFEYFKSSGISYTSDINDFKADCFNGENYLVSFFYHFSSLDTEAKINLFNEIPSKILLYFLQWPLASLFLEDPAGICDSVIRLGLMEWLFVKILEILHDREYMANAISYGASRPSAFKFSDVYSRDHLESIFSVLWGNCPHNIKSRIVDSFAVTHVLNFLEYASSKMDYDRSTLIKDIRTLFLSKGDVFLAFLREEYVADALQNVVSKYMPEKQLDFKLSSLAQSRNVPVFNQRIQELFARLYFLHDLRRIHVQQGISVNGLRPKLRLFDFFELKTPIVQPFVNFIQHFLFANNINASIFHS